MRSIYQLIEDRVPPAAMSAAERAQVARWKLSQARRARQQEREASADTGRPADWGDGQGGSLGGATRTEASR